MQAKKVLLYRGYDPTDRDGFHLQSEQDGTWRSRQSAIKEVGEVLKRIMAVMDVGNKLRITVESVEVEDE